MKYVGSIIDRDCPVSVTDKQYLGPRYEDKDNIGNAVEMSVGIKLWQDNRIYTDEVPMASKENIDFSRFRGLRRAKKLFPLYLYEPRSGNVKVMAK